MLVVPFVVFILHIASLLNLTQVNFYNSNCLLMFQYYLFIEFRNLQIACKSMMTIRFYCSIFFHALIAYLCIATFSLAIHPDLHSCNFFQNNNSLLPSHPIILTYIITACMSQRNQTMELYRYNLL